MNSQRDAYEREADRIADRVMRDPRAELQRTCACGGSCPNCRNRPLLQKKFEAANHASQATIPPVVHEVLRSPGSPLDAPARAFFEPRFGHDFSRVRVHTNAQAAESAEAVHATAYTAGSHIVFDAGRYAPSTAEGGSLLAHELVHVIQQDDPSSETAPAEIQRKLDNEPTRFDTSKVSTNLWESSTEEQIDQEIATFRAKPSASGAGKALAAVDYISKTEMTTPERIAVKAGLLSIIDSQSEDAYAAAEYRLRVRLQNRIGTMTPDKYAFTIVRFDNVRNAEVTLSSTESVIDRGISVEIPEGFGSSTPEQYIAELSQAYSIDFVATGLTVRMPGDHKDTVFPGKAWALNDLRLMKQSLELIGSTERGQLPGVKFRRINRDRYNNTAGFYFSGDNSINMLDSALPWEQGTWFGEGGTEYSRGVFTTLHEIGHMLHAQTKATGPGVNAEVIELFKKAVRDESARLNPGVTPSANAFPPPGIVFPTTYSGTGEKWTDFFSDTYALYLLNPSFLKTPTHQYLYDFFTAQYPR